MTTLHVTCSFICPSVIILITAYGRPVLVNFTKSDMEKMLRRIQENHTSLRELEILNCIEDQTALVIELELFNV